MADEVTQPAPAPEAGQQQAPETDNSEQSLGSMLANIPGLDKYFGEQKSEEPSEPKEDGPPKAPPAEEPIPQEEEVAVAQGAKEPSALEQRIHGLVAERNRKDERISALEAELSLYKEERAKSRPVEQQPAQKAVNPLAHIDNLEALNKRFEQAQELKSWAIENLDGGEITNDKGETQYLDGAQVRKWFAIADKELSRYIPEQARVLEAKAQYNTKRAEFENQAKTYYPQMFKEGTEENKQYKAWVTLLPEITRFPDHQMYIADAIFGGKVRQGKAVARNGSATRNTLAAPSPSSGSKVPQETTVLSKELLDRMAEGDRTALGDYVSSLPMLQRKK
jgi:hypothetical protein